MNKVHLGPFGSTKLNSFRVVGQFLRANLPSVDKLREGDVIYTIDTQETYLVLNGELVQIYGDIDMNLEVPADADIEHRCEYCGTRYYGHETQCKSCGAPL